MPKKLLSPEAARDFLVRRFNGQHQLWVAGGGIWPLDVSLGIPTERDIAEDPAAVRAWAAAWQGRAGPGEVVFEERQFPRLGRHSLPVSLSLATADQVATAVGQSKRWATASGRFLRMVERWPQLAAGNALASRFDDLADYTEENFERLLSLLAWLELNPRSGVYLRQLPVEGLDTKWLEKRTGLVAGLLRAIRAAEAEEPDFYALCGLLKPAHRVRIRLLCPSLRAAVGGLGDIEAPAAELANLSLAPRAVVIVENQETGLALPDIPGTVAIMRLGNAVSVLGALPWLREPTLVYWGDIDTHGFAILDRARRTLPRLQSLLMDEATLLAHCPLWVQEPIQCPNVALGHLTAEERAVYDSLRANSWGPRVRLEQERLGWASSMERLLSVLGGQQGGLETKPAAGPLPQG